MKLKTEKDWNGADVSGSLLNVFRLDEEVLGKIHVNSSIKGTYQFHVFAFNMFNNASLTVNLTIWPCKEEIVSVLTPNSFSTDPYF